MAKEQLKPTLLSTAVAAGLAATTMPAHALTLGISGQINKTIGYIDNGDDSAIGFFDNSISGSRFRFTGEEDIGGGLKVGGVWEWQWQNSPTSSATFNSYGKFDETTPGIQADKYSGYLKDVGLGLRLSPSRTSHGTVTHLDLAYALDSEEGLKKMQFLISTEKQF